MKFLRNRFVHRTISIFLLLIFVQSIILPNYSYALTGGPHQPEYTSYEEPGATDMVNLLTGDFNFNMPILDLPGPEGGFSLPLSYHAGIGVDQEASWVGLGWNINAGAIVRDINQFPDDASGEANTVTVQNLTGVYGYDVQWLAPYRQAWNSVEGKYGNVNLLDIIEVEWGTTNSVGVLGFHVGDGDSFKPEQFVSGVMAIASLGTSAGAEGAVGIIAKQAALQLAIQSSVAFTAAAIRGSSGMGSTDGYWNSNFDSHKSLAFNKNPLTGFVGMKTSWRVWLDQTRQEDMFGVLYSHSPNLVPMNTFQELDFGLWAGCKVHMKGTLQNPVQSFEQTTGTINRGAASDINFTVNNLSYQEQNSPVLLATDQYMVNAPGVSGSITPYRFEVGTVSMPREMTERHIRFAAAPFLNYKVPFVYEGSPGNQYLHHSGGSSTPSSPGFNHGVPRTAGQIIEAFGSTYRQTEFDFQDHVLTTERIRTDINTSNKKIPQGNHVEWMSNAEIGASVTYPNSFMDFLPGGISSPRTSFRSNNLNGIGGYTITAADGRTYHFALPVYVLNEKTESVKVSDSNSKSIIDRSSPFANTWLLTAVTGPDFIDRNENGMVDGEDWGYWIRFNYGKHANSYDYRTPYQETSLDPTGQFSNYTEGQKQLYYLNSIESRSHVALFIKSNREDGKSAKESNIFPLKLDEIVLLKRDNYGKLTSLYGMPNYSIGTTSVCSASQITTDIRSYIKSNCMKRVVFIYDYTLCQSTPNATGANNPYRGKLTLSGISIKGRNNILVHPDYKFEYSNNPFYDRHKWDGWGLYNPSGTESVTSHKTNDPNGSNGSAWSLSKVVTPLGGTLLVNYERDTYSSISGQVLLENTKSYGKYSYTVPFPSDAMREIEVNTAGFSVNDKVRITGDVSYKCSGSSTYTTARYSGDYIVTQVAATFLTLNAAYIGVTGCSPGTFVEFQSNIGVISKIVPDRSGGNLRVGSIVVQNDFGNESKIRYLYSGDDGASSGVVSKEPAFISTTELDFYQYLNYPTTPVLYGRVTVLNGKLSTDFDFTSRKVFEFETPHTSHYTQIREDKGSGENLNDSYLFKLEDRTARIGRLNRIMIYDKAGTLISQSNLAYAENQITNNDGSVYQGVFSTGTLLFDMFNASGKTVINGQGGSGYDYVFLPDKVRMNRTTLIRYPYILKKVTNTKDGFFQETENLKWDFISGQVLEVINRGPLGLNIKTVRIPAYHQYAEMGSKAENLSYRNMLTQMAGEYNYKTDVSGSTIIGLTGAQVQVWRKDWANYRYYDGTKYIDANETISISNPVWRMGATYVWKGDYSRRQTDGSHTFGDVDKFDFSPSASNSLWQFIGKPLRFDHYGMPLEYSDMNGISVATKMGYFDKNVIASASNANFHEITFSSAEDMYADKLFFGGEVGIGNGTVKYLSKGQAATSHTGDAIVSTSSASHKAFVFKTEGLSANKLYRASVWTNNLNGRIYYRIGTSSTDVLSEAPVATKAANGWYRIDLELPSQSSSFGLEIGVKSIAETEVYFDDFRFQPADATMTCYVYPPDNFEFSASGQPLFTYVLSNDNMYTKFEHNERGMLVRTYQESFKHGVKLISESNDNFRRFHVNQ